MKHLIIFIENLYLCDHEKTTKTKKQRPILTKRKVSCEHYLDEP